MTEVKQSIERAIGERFIEWYNNQHGTCYRYESVGANPPDLVYADGVGKLFIEVTTAYYDPADAKIQWGGYRNDPNAPTQWSGMNFDEALFAEVANRLSQKCLGSHEQGTFLVVFIKPALTTVRDVEMLIQKVAVPKAVPFSGIYLCGIFGVSSDSPVGGFQCWKLYGA